jgi:hypothetical protein
MRRRFVKKYCNPIVQQTSNGIVILRERLSWLRRDNFVSLARRRLWGAQAASLQPSAACRRQLADGVLVGKARWRAKKLFGKLPKRTG